MQRHHSFYFLVWLYFTIIILHFSCAKPNTFHLKNGDLLFQDLDSSPLCDAIEKVTTGFNNMNFSHVGIVTIINDKKYVLEAFVNGVDTIELNTFLNRSLDLDQKPKVVVGRLKKQYTYLIPKALIAGMNLIGKEYDEAFKIDNNKFYCSELIYDIFFQADQQNKIFNLEPMTYKSNGKTMTIWIDYFNELNIPIPENEPGINPGGISRSKKINIIHNYRD